MRKITIKNIFIIILLLNLINFFIAQKNLKFVILNCIVCSYIYMFSKDTSMNEFDLKGIKSGMYACLSYTLFCTLTFLDEFLELSVLIYLKRLTSIMIIIFISIIFYFKVKSYKKRHTYL